MKATAALLTMGFVSARQALAQNTPLSGESSNVCGFTLSVDGQELARTNNWTIARNNGTNLATAQFWITSSATARLFGGNGERCTFDPYLECDEDDNDNDNDNTPFTILPNNTLSFTNQSTFYLCARNAFSSIDDGELDPNEDDLVDTPYIYPPIGTSSNTPRNYENCTLTTLVASRCVDGDSAEYNVTGSAAAALGTNVPGGNGTASATATTSSGTSATGTSAGASSSATGGSSNAAGLGRGDMAISGAVVAGFAALFGAALL